MASLRARFLLCNERVTDRQPDNQPDNQPDERTRAAQDAARPPVPPDFERRFRMSRGQWIGLPVLFAIPLFALFGMFGSVERSDRITSGGLDVKLAYPERAHYRASSRLDVVVRNRSSSTLDSVHVSLDTAYIGRFVMKQFSPTAERAYVIALGSIPPGGMSHASVELWADGLWWLRGDVTVSALPPGRNGAPVAVRFPLRTFVFP